jgi:hypothetical protein
MVPAFASGYVLNVGVEPFQGSRPRDLQPRVARSEPDWPSQPWAEGRNPFGIVPQLQLTSNSISPYLDERLV